MPQPSHEALTHEVALRYLRAAVRRKVGAFTMDMLARLSVLEGAAGKAPGTWLRLKERGFGHALDHFGPKLAASWTAATDQGVYDRALAVASRTLRNVSGMDADELVQEMTTHSGTSAGPDRKRLFHSVGKALRRYENDLGQGAITPDHSRVKGTIDRWVTNAARDVIGSWRERHIRTFGPSTPGGYDPTRTVGRGGLDAEKRQNLLLLALQSPGGPGTKLRLVIDHLIRRNFPKSEVPIVRMFLNKIAEPKYRSADQMRQMVQRFDPNAWFTQAYSRVRREMMDELGVSAQRLTNVLGGNARNVFHFMATKVGTHPTVRRLINNLAEEIELLEPAASRIAVEREEDDDSREAEVSSDPTLASVRAVLEQWFEKDEYDGWDRQVGPHPQHGRGPVPLRVARAWMVS